MKLYKDKNGKIFGVGEESDLGGDQSFLIQKDWKLMTAEEIELHVNPPKTQVQLVDEWKSNRQSLVDAIEVTYDGVVYQGDELSQTRISRAITALPDDEVTVPWVAKDNAEHQLTRVELKGLLFQAGLAQSNVWSLGRPSVEAPIVETVVVS